MPQLHITRVEGWPLANKSEVPSQSTSDGTFEVDVEIQSKEDVVEEQKSVIVEISQLRLLLHQCHFCGHSINNSSL